MDNRRPVEPCHTACVSPAQAQLSLLESLTHAAAQERVWAIVTTAVGVAAVLLAVALWLVWARPVTSGAAVPLAMLGAIHAITGAVDFVTLTKERQALPELLQEAPHVLTTEVLPRAVEALATRRLLRFADGFLLVVGLGLLTRRERLFGVGLGLSVMSGVALELDTLALERHAVRVQLLEKVETYLQPR
ncbi:MAG: hypothetical protein Q8S33_11890 [Myxococcales bacterium]|nr:hypothetical protein [Myxococcales bacterium]